MIPLQRILFMGTIQNSPLRTLLCRVGFAVALSLGATTASWGIGSPPLITDDPGTPGKGHWEINVGYSMANRPGQRDTELPLLDFNYGFAEGWQIAYEVPYLTQHTEGEERLAGWGNSGLGVKWRFHDGGETGFSTSVSPRAEFNTPGTNSRDRGLVESGTTFVLPFEFEKAIGPVTLNLEAGHEFRTDADSWIYGVAVSRDMAPKLAAGIELAGTASSSLDRSSLTLNVGLAFDVNEKNSFMVSVGRELHNHAEARASFVGYFGWQFRL
jgi:hypothetical protein